MATAISDEAYKKISISRNLTTRIQNYSQALDDSFFMLMLKPGQFFRLASI